MATSHSATETKRSLQRRRSFPSPSGNRISEGGAPPPGGSYSARETHAPEAGGSSKLASPSADTPPTEHRLTRRHRLAGFEVGPPEQQQPQRALMRRHAGYGHVEDAAVLKLAPLRRPRTAPNGRRPSGQAYSTSGSVRVIEHLHPVGLQAMHPVSSPQSWLPAGHRAPRGRSQRDARRRCTPESRGRGQIHPSPARSASGSHSAMRVRVSFSRRAVP